MDKAVRQKLDDFFSQYKTRKYKKGEILIRADDNPTGIFYLSKGLVKMYCISNKGDEIILNIFKPNSFFPLSWAINNTQNTYFYEALTEALIQRAPKEEALTYIKQDPQILYDLLSRLFNGIDGVLQRMTYLMSGTAYSRLITEILLTAKRFSKSSSGTYSISISEKDLAAQTGMTRETVSREMSILKKRGLISFNKGTLKVLDLTRLTHELSVIG